MEWLEAHSYLFKNSAEGSTTSSGALFDLTPQAKETAFWQCLHAPAISNVVGWVMATKNIQFLIPGTCECYLIWHFADVAKLSILIWRDYSGLPGWALNAITSVLSGEREREIWHRSRRQCDRWGEMLFLKMEGRRRNQGCKKCSSRNWKMQGNRFSLRTCRGSRALLTPWFWPRGTDFRLWTSRNVRESMCVVISHQVCGNTIGS